MIEKLERHIRIEKGLTQDIKISCPPGQPEIVSKINELCDTVNKLETMAKNTNTVLKSLVEENNIHKKQIDELQMKAEHAENTTYSKMENVAENGNCAKIAQGFKNLQDPYAEQRKWIGKLCCFWDTGIGEKVWGILGGIDYSENVKYPYWCDQLQEQYQNCEPVKPDDDIIYKGE